MNSRKYTSMSLISPLKSIEVQWDTSTQISTYSIEPNGTNTAERQQCCIAFHKYIPYRFHINENNSKYIKLTHLPRCRIYASVNWVNIGSDNGLSPVRHQAITWTSAGLLPIGLLGTNCSGIRIVVLLFFFKKTHLKLSSAKMSATLSRGRCVNHAIRPINK